MYFYQGYAIHGTYWHNAFGRQMSHGCVNLPVDESQWFFNFASVGTPVRVVS
jgi:lipoprotein-anchoring transpeptidase ErfK/SrfK